MNGGPWTWTVYQRWNRYSEDGTSVIGITVDLRGRTRRALWKELKWAGENPKRLLNLTLRFKVAVLAHANSYQEAGQLERQYQAQARERGQVIENDNDYNYIRYPAEHKRHVAGGTGRRPKRSQPKPYPLGEVNMMEILGRKRPTGGPRARAQEAFRDALGRLKVGERVTAAELRRRVRCSAETLRRLTKELPLGIVYSGTGGRGRPALFTRAREETLELPQAPAGHPRDEY